MDSLRAIRHLACAAQDVSRLAAADVQGVSVAAVARRVDALESGLKVRLLAHHANGVAPAAPGGRF